MQSTTRRFTRLTAAAFAAALVLTACGSSSGGDTATQGTDTTVAAASGDATTTTAAAGASTDLVKVKKDAKLGDIVANAKGLTLYTLTDASGKAVPCTGACLGVWPPALVPDGVTTVTGADGVMLAVGDDPAGKIITAGGLPLYTFVKDTDGEDAYGEGLASFGGTWHVVKADGSASTTPAAGGDETTTSGY